MSSLKVDPKSVGDYVSNHFKFFILSLFGALLIVVAVAVSIFFITVRGAEQTLVPDVQGKELTEALLELQIKELYPRIQLRYSQYAGDRGRILEQEPRAGTIVRAGRRIRIVVSQGVLISHVGNYVGRDIDEVRLELQALYATPGGLPLLSVREPLIFDFSAESPGTILRQRPEPGVGISGPMALEFVVSRGPERAAVTMPQLTGLGLSQAMERISNLGFNFEFRLREPQGNETGETIVAQTPAANTTIPANSTLQLVATVPTNLAAGEVFNLFRHTVPMNPFPLAMRLEALLPTGERILLVNVEHPGGVFSVPYRLPLGSTLILSMLNREVHREFVTAQQDLSLF